MVQYIAVSGGACDVLSVFRQFACEISFVKITENYKERGIVHRHSCPSIMIICIQPRAVAGADAGMALHVFFLSFLFFEQQPLVPPPPPGTEWRQSKSTKEQ